MNDKIKELKQYSNPLISQQNAFKYLGHSAILYPSPRKNKKYRIYDPNNNKWIDFGSIGYKDFTKTPNDFNKRDRYLKRATKIKGNWALNPYSPNNLSINILWM